MKADTIVKLEGMSALISKLGYVDAERFIVLITREPFDYTKWRESILKEDISIRELSQKAMAYSKNLKHIASAGHSHLSSLETFHF